MRPIRALARWLQSRHRLHQACALMDRDLHEALNRSVELHQRVLKLNHRIKDLEAHHNDWSNWEAELNG